MEYFNIFAVSITAMALVTLVPILLIKDTGEPAGCLKSLLCLVLMLIPTVGAFIILENLTAIK